MYPKSCNNPTLTIYTSVAALPETWDALLPADHALQSKALSIYELIQLPDIITYYALLGRREKPYALAYFQVLQVKPKHVNTGLLQGLSAKLVPLLLRLFRPSLLVAGHLFRHDMPTFYASPALSNMEVFRAYETLIHSVSKKSCALATLVKDVPTNMVPYFQNFASSYTQLRNDISMQMQLPDNWKSLADYESALKHKYAQKFRKVRIGLNELRITELTTTQVFDNAAVIYNLYEQVSHNQAFSMGLLNEQFIPELKKAYGAKLKVWAFYEGETMVAFASAWLHKEAFDMFYIGFDYKRNAEYNLYFNILYFSIEQAILADKPLLILGRTALEAKARVGCTPRYLHTFLEIRTSWLRTLVAGKMNSQHQEEGAWEERHPIKSF